MTNVFFFIQTRALNSNLLRRCANQRNLMGVCAKQRAKAVEELSIHLTRTAYKAARVFLFTEI
jgi:hypothetical protein